MLASGRDRRSAYALPKGEPETDGAPAALVPATGQAPASVRTACPARKRSRGLRRAAGSPPERCAPAKRLAGVRPATAPGSASSGTGPGSVGQGRRVRAPFHFPGGGLPRISGRPAPASPLSMPARRSLLAAACLLAKSLKDPLHWELQPLRRLHDRPGCDRMEGQLPGGNLTRRESAPCTEHWDLQAGPRPNRPLRLERARACLKIESRRPRRENPK